MSAAPEPVAAAEAAPVELHAAAPPADTPRKTGEKTETPTPKRTRFNFRNLLAPLVPPRTSKHAAPDKAENEQSSDTAPEAEGKPAEAPKGPVAAMEKTRRLSAKPRKAPANLLDRTRRALEETISKFEFEQGKTEEAPGRAAKARAVGEEAKAQEEKPGGEAPTVEKSAAATSEAKSEKPVEEGVAKDKSTRRLTVKPPKLPSNLLGRNKKASKDASNYEHCKAENHEKAEKADAKPAEEATTEKAAEEATTEKAAEEAKAEKQPVEEATDAKGATPTAKSHAPVANANVHAPAGKAGAARRLSFRAGRMSSSFWDRTKKALGEATRRPEHGKKSPEPEAKQAEPVEETTAEERKPQEEATKTERPAEATA